MSTTAPAGLAAALPGYDLGDVLGRGSFGVVYAGQHRQLGRKVAIKELPRGLASDDDVRARFASEARVLASLQHPHLVPVYDYVEHDGLCLLVMERLEGGTVLDRFFATGVTIADACAITLVTCAGLAHAHRNGILHRDIKPENLLFSADDTLKVTDFGIAKVLGGNDELATRAGEFLGTPAYMAPEQTAGIDVGPPADVYGAATMLYELLSGRLPFSEEGGAIAVACRHLYEDPIPLGAVAPDLPGPLVEAVMHGLERSPEDRFPSADAFGVAVGQAASDALGVGWLGHGHVRLLEPGVLLDSATLGSGPVAHPDRSLPTIHVRSPHPPPGLPSRVSHVPVQQLIPRPPLPLKAAAISAVLAVCLVLVAVIGLASPRLERRAGKGELSVQGVDVSDKRSVPIDLGQPIVVRLSPAALAAASHLVPDAVQIEFSVAGVPLGKSSRETFQDGVARPSATSLTRIIPGRVTGRLILLKGGAEVGHTDFPVTIRRGNLVTVPGALVILGLCFVLGYGATYLRALMRNPRRRSPLIGLTATGAPGGLLVVLLVWLAGWRQPTFGTTIACVALSAALAGATGITTTRIARRGIGSFAGRSSGVGS